MPEKQIEQEKKRLERQGYIVRIGGNGHYKVYKRLPNGKLIYMSTMPKTSKKSRSLKNAQAHLRRMERKHNV